MRACIIFARNFIFGRIATRLCQLRLVASNSSSDLKPSEGKEGCLGLLDIVLHLLDEFLLRLLVFGLADHSGVEFEDFGWFELARIVDVDQAKQALANVIGNLHVVLLDEILLPNDLIEKILELVIVQKAPPEHLGLQHVNLIEKDLERDELLLVDLGVFFAQLLVDLGDLQAELFDVCAGQVGQLCAEQLGRGNLLVVIRLQRVELVVPQVLPEPVLQVDQVTDIDAVFIFEQYVD